MKGRPMRITVDPDRCQGHAQCWDLCPEVFSLDEEGHSVVTAEEVPAGLEAKTSRAAANCPERAITVSPALR
jgi:ferredoxin